MAYLAKARKLELIEICEELGIEVDSSSKVPDIKKLILSSEFYEEEEVKIILERVLEDRKQQKEREERREANQHELELKKLELSHRYSRQRDESEQINEKNGSSFSKSETVIDVCDASSSQIVPEQIQDSEISNKSECSASISKIVPEKTTGTIVKNIKVSEDVLQVENMLKNTETEPKRMEKSDSRSSPISGLEKVIRELREREKDLMAAIEAKDSQLAILKIRLQEADQELKLKRNVAKELEVENEKMIKEHAQSAVFQNKTVEVLQEQLQQTETELNKTKDSLLQNKINTRKKKKKKTGTNPRLLRWA